LQKYIIRRILQAIPILLGVSIIIFALTQAMPGDPLSHMMDPNITKEDLESAREKLGLNDPKYVQYFRWLGELLSGNLGFSTKYSKPVGDLIKERIGPTFTLSLLALTIALVFAIPIGVYSATKQYSKWDNLFTVFAFAGISIPVFFLALVLIWLFALQLQWFPSGGLTTPGVTYEFPKNIFNMLYHLVLPSMTLALLYMASFMRYTRSSMLEVIRQDYIRTARAKGLSEKVVIYKHALRNALIPVITILGLSLPGMFSGALVTETIFSLPGMGTLSYNAVVQRDYPILMATNLMFAIWTIVGNLLADIFYALVDPRIRYD